MKKDIKNTLYTLYTLCITIIMTACNDPKVIQEQINSVTKQINNLQHAETEAIEDSLTNNQEFMEIARNRNQIVSNIESAQIENLNLQEIANRKAAKNFPISKFLDNDNIHLLNLRIQCENMQRKKKNIYTKLDTLTTDSNIADLFYTIIELDNNAYQHEKHAHYINFTQQDIFDTTYEQYGIHFHNTEKEKLLQQWKESGDLNKEKVIHPLKKAHKLYQQNNNTIKRLQQRLYKQEQISENVSEHFHHIYTNKKDSLNRVLKNLQKRQK